ERITKDPAENELPALVEALDVLLGRLPPDQAAGPAARAAQAVVNSLCKVKPASGGGFGRVRPPAAGLDKPLRTLSRRLSAAQAGRHVESLLDALGRARQTDGLCRVALGIEALSDRLPPGDAEKALARAVQPLLLALGKAPSVAEFAQLAAALECVA